jgi:hypothetical protein
MWLLLKKFSKKHTMRGQLWSLGNIANTPPEVHLNIENFARYFAKFARKSLFTREHAA